MTTMLKLTLLVAVAALLANGQRFNRLRRKAECPPPQKIATRQRVPDRLDFYRGSCEQMGGRRDTCRKRMSCCENSQGDMICVRARIYFPKYRPQSLPPPNFLPMPPMNDMMQNDVEIRNPLCPPPMPLDKPCIGDIMANFCGSDFECSPDRICCPDPCPSDLLPTNLCLLPMKPTVDISADNIQEENFPPTVPAVDIFPTVSNIPTLRPTDNTVHPEAPTGETFKVPTSASPTTDKNTAVDEKKQAATHGDETSSQHPSCPKLGPQPGDKCNEDGSICAVACPGYDGSYNECTDDSACASGRVCCQDPCPNSPLKLCFPEDNSVVATVVR